MTGVLFVCHGNICRSPMAEFILKDMVKRRGVGEVFIPGTQETLRRLSGICMKDVKLCC